ncbi:unnamed protein product [Linum trigynum]|uniref:Uncharacterized protein n=1 Tax=Linum trigynum TaxID=586398 RepID=A0AAV2CDN8_9ROSI
MERQGVEAITRRTTIELILRAAILDHKIGIKKFNGDGIRTSQRAHREKILWSMMNTKHIFKIIGTIRKKSIRGTIMSDRQTFTIAKGDLIRTIVFRMTNQVTQIGGKMMIGTGVKEPLGRGLAGCEDWARWDAEPGVYVG